MFKRKKLIAVLCIIAISVGSLTVFISRQYVLPILMYHSVSASVPQGNRIIVSVDTFQRQMKFLKEHNYNVLTLEAAGDLIKNKKKIPARSIVLTLDDGYKDNYIYALPVLKKYNFPATIFIVFSQVGMPGMLNWDEIKQMQDSGLITFGSHTINHPFLEFVKTDEELIREIGDSKNLMENNLNKVVNTFSYPMGRFSERARNLVIACGYKVGVVTNPGKKYPNDDVFALKRLRISENAKNLFVFWIESSGYYNFIREHRHK